MVEDEVLPLLNNISITGASINLSNNPITEPPSAQHPRRSSSPLIQPAPLTSSNLTNNDVFDIDEIEYSSQNEYIWSTVDRTTMSDPETDPLVVASQCTDSSSVDTVSSVSDICSSSDTDDIDSTNTTDNDIHKVNNQRIKFPLQCILFSEFDNELGTRLSYQYPVNTISSAVFDSISDILIIEPELCNKLIEFNTQQYNILSIALVFHSSIYARNTYYCNLSMYFVRDVSQSNTIISMYKPVLYKLSQYLSTLELQSYYLSSINNTAVRNDLLQKVCQQLNTYGETNITVNNSNRINLKLYPILDMPPHVNTYDVPIQLINIQSIQRTEWDLTLCELINYIDGVSTIYRISVLSGIHITLVIKCIEQLLYYRCIQLIDCFQYTNIYQTTDKLHLFIQSDPTIQSQCCIAVALYTNQRIPQFHYIIKLLSLFHRNNNVKSIIYQYRPAQYNIDIQKLIVYAATNHIIQRIYCYPICVDRMYDRDQHDQYTQKILSLIDNQRHIDSICCELNTSHIDVINTLTAISSIVFIWK